MSATIKVVSYTSCRHVALQLAYTYGCTRGDVDDTRCGWNDNNLMYPASEEEEKKKFEHSSSSSEQSSAALCFYGWLLACCRPALEAGRPGGFSGVACV